MKAASLAPARSSCFMAAPPSLSRSLAVRFAGLPRPISNTRPFGSSGGAGTSSNSAFLPLKRLALIRAAERAGSLVVQFLDCRRQFAPFQDLGNQGTRFGQGQSGKSSFHGATSQGPVAAGEANPFTALDLVSATVRSPRNDTAKGVRRRTGTENALEPSCDIGRRQLCQCFGGTLRRSDDPLG